MPLSFSEAISQLVDALRYPIVLSQQEQEFYSATFRSFIRGIKATHNIYMRYNLAQAKIPSVFLEITAKDSLFPLAIKNCSKIIQGMFISLQKEPFVAVDANEAFLAEQAVEEIKVFLALEHIKLTKFYFATPKAKFSILCENYKLELLKKITIMEDMDLENLNKRKLEFFKKMKNNCIQEGVFIEKIDRIIEYIEPKELVQFKERVLLPFKTEWMELADYIAQTWPISPEVRSYFVFLTEQMEVIRGVTRQKNESKVLTDKIIEFVNAEVNNIVTMQNKVFSGKTLQNYILTQPGSYTVIEPLLSNQADHSVPNNSFDADEESLQPIRRTRSVRKSLNNPEAIESIPQFVSLLTKSSSDGNERQLTLIVGTYGEIHASLQKISPRNQHIQRENPSPQIEVPKKFKGFRHAAKAKCTFKMDGLVGALEMMTVSNVSPTVPRKSGFGKK